MHAPNLNALNASPDVRNDVRMSLEVLAVIASFIGLALMVGLSVAALF